MSKIKIFINFINKNIILSIILGLLIVIFLQVNKSGFSVYYIFKKNYDLRLAKSYEKIFYSGYCEKGSHGYILDIKNRFPDNSIPEIINFEIRKKPYWLFKNINLNVSKKKVILLNYDLSFQKKINFLEYEILDNYKNRCFFLKKND
jgi:hypothetical protein